MGPVKNWRVRPPVNGPEEVARVMDTVAIATRNRPASLTTSGTPAVDTKKEDGDQPYADVSAAG